MTTRDTIARFTPVVALISLIVALSACSMDAPSTVTMPRPGATGSGSTKAAGVPGTKAYYVSLARADALDAGIDADCFQRQIQQESGFDPGATGHDGEIGIAQFMPSTAAGLGINPADPVDALKGAAGLMGRFYRKYGDYSKALAAYNAGSGSLATAERNCGGAWLDCLPRSTKAYIRIVMGG